ncbi:hypothetical protein HDE_07750 [Halotydeus destructor]|nr:hypothetical protein HDE_07750 [Halotydeus destructor]
MSAIAVFILVLAVFCQAEGKLCSSHGRRRLDAKDTLVCSGYKPECCRRGVGYFCCSHMEFYREINQLLQDFDRIKNDTLRNLTEAWKRKPYAYQRPRRAYCGGGFVFA